jgi:AmmeMemoRadiSam system protein A
MENSNQKFLLKLARKSLEYIFRTGKEFIPNNSDIPEELNDIKATFVTLTKNERLRGCIGKLKAIQELYKDVIENTYSAAFNDPRFPQLSKEELPQVKIEISVLEEPKKLKYKDSSDLIAKLAKTKPGVILGYGFYSATFLPQVWEELPEAEDFLSHLCQKAKLEPNTWKHEKLEIQTYNVAKFKEK